MWIAGAVAAAVMVSGAAMPQPKAMMEAAAAAAAASQVKDELFAGTEKFAQGAKETTEVNLDKDMLGLVGGKGGDLAKKIDFVVVHTYEYDKPGMYRREDVEVFRKRLTDGSWNCFVHTQEKDESTDVCKRLGGDNETNELVVITAEPTELTFVHMKGRMSLADLQKMGGGGMGALMTPATPATPLKKRE